MLQCTADYIEIVASGIGFVSSMTSQNRTRTCCCCNKEEEFNRCFEQDESGAESW